MKLLLDECVPVGFRHYLAKHVVHTVQFAGFKAKRNGELMKAAEEAGYEVLITVDRDLPAERKASAVACGGLELRYGTPGHCC